MAITKTAKRKVAKRKATTRKKMAAKRKASTHKRMAAKHTASTRKRMAAKRKASSKRRAASRMDYVSRPPRFRRPVIQSRDIYPERKHRIEKIPEGTEFYIKFKIDSGDMKKDSSVLGKIMNDVDLICATFKIKYNFNVSTGCLFVVLGLFFVKQIAAGLVTIAIWELIKKINSRNNTKTTHVDDELKHQLAIAALANRGYVGYTIEYTEELPIGTRFSILLATGETISIIVNEQGKLSWF